MNSIVQNLNYLAFATTGSCSEKDGFVQKKDASHSDASTFSAMTTVDHSVFFVMYFQVPLGAKPR